MAVDGRPIRDKARQEYEQVLLDLKRARKQIEQFETKDRPLFTQWVTTQFGALLTEIREAMHQLQAKRDLLMQVDQEAFWGECSHARAYARVMHRKENPPPPEPDPDQRDRAAADESSAKRSEEQRLNDEFFSFLEDELNTEVPPTAPKKVPARLKELYRALARRLHPDIQGSMNSQQKEWWHQAQSAYQSGDVEQLEVILTLCQIGEEGTTAKTSVSLLMRITRQVKSSLRTLKTQLNQYRRDPAWNFSALRNRSALRERMERNLHLEQIEIARTLQAVETQLEIWARQARRSEYRPRRVSRRPRRHPECPF
jgi:hypothetical protein